MKELFDRLINNFEEEKNPLPIISGMIGKPAIFEKINDSKNNITVGFVDGGNTTLFSGPNFIIAKVRVGHTIFQGKKNLEEKKEDFNVFCYFDNGWKAKFNKEIIEINNSSILDNGRENAEKIPQLIRRLLELRTASKLISDYVILDGTLDGTFELEELRKLSDKVLGFAKTNSIRTVKGNSYTALLAKFGPEIFVCKNVLPNISFVKLSKSPYVFRIDGLLTEELLFFLKNHATDPEIIGYPYGLVVADRIARIPDYERKILRVKLFSEFGIHSKNFRTFLAGKDIHEFLDGQNIY